MTDLLEFWQYPNEKDIVMLAGWRQWADAGNISSGLLRYLINQTEAHRIGRLNTAGCYLFQVPGAHHFLRPDVVLEDGLVKSHQAYSNEFFYCTRGDKGLVLFLGEEPHLAAETYGDAWLNAVEALHVRRVVCLGGVYGPMPYDRERELHAVYSVPSLRSELEPYAVKFSDYEGGSTIGTYLAYRAGQRGIELLDLYAFVPSYDFAQLSQQVQGLRIESDYQAWFEVMRRINHMFDLGLDLNELEVSALELASSMDSKIEELGRKYPTLKVKDFMQQLADAFEENSFAPLDDLWERELGDLLDDLEA
ncbi:MAG: PAC2 family protein [Caldilineales bacterium]